MQTLPVLLSSRPYLRTLRWLLGRMENCNGTKQLNNIRLLFQELAVIIVMYFFITSIVTPFLFLLLCSFSNFFFFFFFLHSNLLHFLGPCDNLPKNLQNTPKEGAQGPLQESHGKYHLLPKIAQNSESLSSFQ
mmetsp:Transcript_20484/g.31990  ORF Transcript_20484/g.31990 Transcript_20484/m.31990 type:complete len:133 (-) Transcript_20484:551-949(-)